MSADFLITDEVRQLLGKELMAPATLKIEKGAIRLFCQAIGDTNPLWQDEDYARSTRFGGTIAPPNFLSQLLFWDGDIQRRVGEIKTPVSRMLNGGNEFEYCEVVRPGDVITARVKLVDAYEREGKTGKILFLVSEVTYTNQKEALVATERTTIVRY